MKVQRITGLALFVACSHGVAGMGAVGGGGAGMNPTAMTPEAWEVMAAHPGARVYIDGDRVRMFYGAPMTGGATAQAAAESWLRNHAGALGAGPLELEEVWATPVMSGRFTALGYRQYIDGLPVEYGNVRILVLNEPEPRVVYAGATVAPRPAGEDVQLELDGDTAQAIVGAMPLFRGLVNWSDPELAIYHGDGAWIDPVVVWKFSGDNTDGQRQHGDRSKTFFVHAATGELVHVRSEIYHDQITGSVKGWTTPGTLPDGPNNPPVLEAISEMRVRVDGGPSVFTGSGGLFSISGAGTSLVNIGTGVGEPEGFGGRWVNVVPVSAAPVHQLLQVTPPGTADFVLNPSPSEFLTTQVNVFVGTTLVYNYFRDRAPNFTGLDVALRANTGVTDVGGQCNAYFRATDPSINFHNAGGNCPNTGYSSVIAHEYGHFIVNRLGLGQGGFGEGYSDTTAMLLYDDGVVGRGFFGESTILRDPKNANVQYPCPTSGSGSGVHHCGQILGGSWWRIRENFGSYYGSEPGLEQVRDMKVAWSLITVGGEGPSFRQSAHPGTAIEVLVIDDDDGNLANGTPNWERICDAFGAHGVDCPPLTYLQFEFPGGVPTTTPVNDVLEVPVNIIPVATPAQQESLELKVRLDGGAFTSAPVTQVGQDQYIATLPAAGCGDFMDFYVEGTAIGGQTVRYPKDAPASYLTARAVGGAAETVAFEDDFSTDKGWTVWNDPSLTEGHWERVVPRGTTYGPDQAQPGTPYRGQMCYLTENGLPGSSVNSHDVDWGPTVLTSPRIDISGAEVADLTFAYWLYTINGVPDDLEVDVSPDDGQTWVRIANYGNSHGWRSVRFDLLEYVSPTPDLRIRFTIEDFPNDSLTEAAVDAVRVVFWECPAECYADCDGNETLNVGDFLCFIDAFASQDPYADCDGNGVFNVTDFLCFIDEFAEGCW